MGKATQKMGTVLFLENENCPDHTLAGTPDFPFSISGLFDTTLRAALKAVHNLHDLPLLTQQCIWV